MSPQRWFGCTILEKWKICQARHVLAQRVGEMPLKKFCNLFPNREGKAMPQSTMSMILNQSNQLLSSAVAPGDANAMKMKKQGEQFPIFERLLAEWIEKASNPKVLISDEVIKRQGRNLITELDQQVDMVDIQNFEEDYTGSELSNGWLAGFETQNGLAKQRYACGAGSIDPGLVEPARHNKLIDVSPRDTYNIDETSFQEVSTGDSDFNKYEILLIVYYRYNLRPSSTIGHKGQAPRGEKKIWTRITGFFVTNADGSDKYKLSVINQWKQPTCFKAAGLNSANVPVYY